MGAAKLPTVARAESDLAMERKDFIMARHAKQAVQAIKDRLAAHTPVSRADRKAMVAYSKIERLSKQLDVIEAFRNSKRFEPHMADMLAERERSVRSEITALSRATHCKDM